MYDISAGEFNVCVREVYAKFLSTRPESVICDKFDGA